MDLSNYVDVAERIRIFKSFYPTGSLQPVDPQRPYWVETIGDRTFIVYASAAYRTPDDPRPGIGLAWEPFPGRTPYTKDSELMVCETSSWGRAIVATLAADTQRIASRQEVENRIQQEPAKKPTRAKLGEKAEPETAKPTLDYPTEPSLPAPSKAQVQYIRRTAQALANDLQTTEQSLLDGLCGCDPQDLNPEAVRFVIEALTRGRQDKSKVEIDAETGKVTIRE